MNAQIAQHLNIAEALIAEVQEWAHVLFVKFISGRPRFVSKKAVMTYKNARHEAFCALSGKYVEDLPTTVWSPAASPFLPAKEVYEGTELTPNQVLAESAKYASKYRSKVEASPERDAENLRKHGNKFGYLG